MKAVVTAQSAGSTGALSRHALPDANDPLAAKTTVRHPGGYGGELPSNALIDDRGGRPSGAFANARGPEAEL